MTLRELLHLADLDAVYMLINKKDSSFEPKSDAHSLSQTTKAYTSVVCELMKKPKVRKYSMPILVQVSKDPFDKHEYPDVCFLNPRYVAPPKGYKPWGGNKNLPPKHYNCNLNKHSKTFAMGFVPWSKIIDTPVLNKCGFSNEQLLAEILWELTFYGWTEKIVEKTTNGVKLRLDEAMKEVKEGKYIELPPKKKGGCKIVVPDCVSQQLLDIINKRK